MVQGIYKFELKVTDDNSAMGFDTVQITVNAAGNIPPVANAGSDQTITLPTNTILLNGNGADTDGTVVSYAWTKISGPAAGTISNANSASTSVTGLIQGVYNFELKVIDNNGATGFDTIQITVNAAPNIPPVANAGIDQTITLPTNIVLLNGSGTDADGIVISYTWTKISGPAAGTIIYPAYASTSVTGLVQGVYIFVLKATDNSGDTGFDTVQITVNPAANISPVANAGIDQTITLPTNIVLLNGSGTDIDGTVVSYAWTKISGPSVGTIINTTSASTSVTGLVQGIYNFELKVTDNSGDVGFDTVQITVNAAVNISPVANAGPDQTIKLPVSSVNLSGSGIDIDGTITEYVWTKISGPAFYKIANNLKSATTVSGLMEGTYTFELKVTDNNGATGTDTMLIVVNADGNIPPIANAGNDKTIILPENTVLLIGSGTDADGTITGYSWKQLSGPTIGGVVSSNTANTRTNILAAGTYEFELTVTDNMGAVGKDTVFIAVDVPRLNVSLQTTDIKFYPNPVINIATLEVHTIEASSKIEVFISNIQGQIVYKNEFSSVQGYINQKINLSNLLKGIYTISVYFNDQPKQTIKIIKAE